MAENNTQATFGDYKASVLTAQRFRLDGGAMFGSVPKVLWEKKIPADSENRIQLVSRILILDSADKRVLVDLGSGKKWSEKENKIYHFEQSSPKPLHEQISGVSDVIITHLHFDHAGGVSYRDESGELQLSFPDAVHHVQSENWKLACAPGPRERATYLADNVEPLKSAKLNLCEDGDEILPGISVHRADGHTHGLQWVLVGDSLACPSEMMPTAHHTSVPYVMGYDLSAEKTMEEKTVFAEKAIAGNWTLVFGHDADTAAGTLGTDDRGRYVLKETRKIPEFSSLLRPKA